MKLKISVALATYNGAPYLREQLDSLAVQERPPDELVACDDGSTDETLSILEQFAADAPFPVHIHRNARNLGYVRNFLSTAARCSGDWIAFCDQDDVWRPHKLAAIEQRIEAVEDAVLVVHAAQVTDAALVPNGRMVPRFPRADVIERLAQPLWFKVPGFCQTFRAELVREIPFDRLPGGFFSDDREQTADKRIVWLANMLGRTVLLHEPLALHRRHATNASDLTEPRASLDDRENATRYNAFRSGRADEYTAELERLSGVASEAGLRAGLLAGAAHYRRLARGYRLRALLDDRSYAKRMSAFGKLLVQGYYAPGGFGIRGAVRDLGTAIAANPRSVTSGVRG